jgi:hypothetical protein
MRDVAADDTAARIGRRLAWRFEDDGSLAGTFRLSPLAGAVLLKPHLTGFTSRLLPPGSRLKSSWIVTLLSTR